ncbi:hypothetical protein PRIPAC_86656 [Pristionchus pacificus]|uniref:Membrane transporter n=1 Tax=Pristionchus pacificus TaxID=54126 RepID=A0A2A6BK63_PRIPA|nr:hypothetical protein PRIPAC_86656 [Pristionchus pacificus]|eukprot:PDM66302.1 membrane transporter [Pristionchus pacificus]
MDNNGRLNFTPDDLNKAMLAGQRAAAPHTGMNKLISCARHTQPLPEWTDGLTGCQSAFEAAAAVAAAIANNSGNAPSTSQASVCFPDPRSYCPCADFYVCYLHVEVSAPDPEMGAEQEIAARVVGEGLVLKLELRHRVGRGCIYVVEPRFVLDVCFDWNRPLHIDLTHFKRQCRFAKPPRPYLYEIQLDILAIATLCCTSILANMNIYNFTKICADPIEQDLDGNYTTMSSNFTRTQEMMIQGAPAVGALVSSIPYMLTFNRYSGRFVFLSAGVISIVSTALAPLGFSLGFWGFLVARAVQGISFSTVFQVIGLITAEWAALGEHGIFLAFLTGCTQLSNIFTMPVSGAICSTSLGWPWVFYVHAIVCAVLFALWVLIYRNSPDQHGMVTESELERIKRGKAEKKGREPVPYTRILTDIGIWTAWLSAFADLLYVQARSTELASAGVAGFLSAVPIIAQFGAKLLSGISSDYLSCVSDTMNVKIYNTLALIVSGGFMIGLAFVPKDQQLLCVIAIIMNIWAACILIEPLIVEPILTDRTSQSQWLIVFSIHGGFAIISGVIFLFTANAEPAPWTHSLCEKEMTPWQDSTSGSTLKLEETEEEEPWSSDLRL